MVSLSNSPFSRSLCRLDGLDLIPSGGGGLGLEEKEIIWVKLLVMDCDATLDSHYSCGI